MNRKGLRYLSMGFFFSAVLLGGIQLIEQPEATEYSTEIAGDIDTAASTTSPNENKSSSEDASDEPVSDLTDSEKDEQTEDGNEDEEASSQETEENEPETISIVVEEGQPSSVIATQLETEGVIEDAFEFDTYLEENNYSTKIRPGHYEVTEEMSFSEIVDVILNR